MLAVVEDLATIVVKLVPFHTTVQGPRRVNPPTVVDRRATSPEIVLSQANLALKIADKAAEPSLTAALATPRSVTHVVVQVIDQEICSTDEHVVAS